MNYEIVFTRSADSDLEDAFKWYESMKPLLGWEFREKLSNCIEKIIDDRVDHQIYSGNIRKIKLQRFPYKVYYIKDIQQRQIIVLAVFHVKMNPAEIKMRLR